MGFPSTAWFILTCPLVQVSSTFQKRSSRATAPGLREVPFIEETPLHFIGDIMYSWVLKIEGWTNISHACSPHVLCTVFIIYMPSKRQFIDINSREQVGKKGNAACITTVTAKASTEHSLFLSPPTNPHTDLYLSFPNLRCKPGQVPKFPITV